MIWVYLITTVVMFTLMFVYSKKGTSSDPTERRKFHLIWQAGILALAIERLIYQSFIR